MIIVANIGREAVCSRVQFREETELYKRRESWSIKRTTELTADRTKDVPRLSIKICPRRLCCCQWCYLYFHSSRTTTSNETPHEHSRKFSIPVLIVHACNDRIEITVGNSNTSKKTLQLGWLSIVCFAAGHSSKGDLGVLIISWNDRLTVEDVLNGALYKRLSRTRSREWGECTGQVWTFGRQTQSNWMPGVIETQ